MDAVSSGSTSRAASPSSGLQWKNRGKSVIGPTHRRRIRQSQCGWYRVVHSRCLYGPRKGRQAIPDSFYAMKLVVVSRRICWDVISEHRTPGPAFRACEKDAKNNRNALQTCSLCGERPPVRFEVPTLFDSGAQLCDECWKYLHRRPRPRRGSAEGAKPGNQRRLPSSSDQLKFLFCDEIQK